MLTHPADPGRVLLELADLTGDGPPPAFAAYADELRTTLAWARDYLCHPHPDLGRQGPVCPYARAALDRGSLYLSVCAATGPEHDQVVTAMRGFHDWFEELDDGDPLLAFLILFPDVRPDELTEAIEGAQRRLKAGFVARGLMVGEFHPGPPVKTGLWNDRFHPLRSPVPLLAIRRMVPTDYPFLRDEPEHLASYRARFGEHTPKREPKRERPDGHRRRIHDPCP